MVPIPYQVVYTVHIIPSHIGNDNKFISRIRDCIFMAVLHIVAGCHIAAWDYENMQSRGAMFLVFSRTMQTCSNGNRKAVVITSTACSRPSCTDPPGILAVQQTLRHASQPTICNE